MGFEQARKTLHGVKFDVKQEEIFFPINDGASYFVCDWDEHDVDFKMVVTPLAPDVTYDLLVAKGKGGGYKKKSRVYIPPKVCKIFLLFS
jgi:hypothetical protein